MEEPRLCAFPKGTKSEITKRTFNYLFRAEPRAGKRRIPFFKFLLILDKESEPESTECEAEALTSTPLSRVIIPQDKISSAARKALNDELGTKP